MSVLKNKRTVSKAEYVNVANQICDETLEFLSRLSARYSRLLAPDISALAMAVADNAEEANPKYPSDDLRLTERTKNLLTARAKLAALDVQMARCYSVLYQNPQGAFVNNKGKSIPPAEAMAKLESMSQSLGEKIDAEKDLLTGPAMPGAVPSMPATPTISALSIRTAAPTTTTRTIPGGWPPDFTSP